MSTRKIVSFVVALAFATAAATPALAVTVTRADGQPMNPNGEPFSATGATNLTKGGVAAACVSTFNGIITSSGIVTITSAQFSGGGLCGLISGSATSANPWTGQADDTTHLTINNAQVNASILGTCGPSKVTTTWTDATSALAFNNSVLTPNCTVNGSLTTSPAFHVQ
jgi:hypothetical protein